MNSHGQKHHNWGSHRPFPLRLLGRLLGQFNRQAMVVLDSYIYLSIYLLILCGL